MDIGAIVSRARKAAADNTPTILTAMGVTGTITTVLLASKASFKASQILMDVEAGLISQDSYGDEVEQENFDFQCKLKNTWKLYIPATTTGIATLGCIMMANRVGTRRAAAIASAYTVSQEAFREYREKVVDKIGEKKEQVVRDEIAQDRVNKNLPSVIITSNTNSICLDTHSGRYFDCDMETIRKAVNDINYKLHSEDYASLSDFWELIGLAKTADSDEVGWNIDSKLEVAYAAALTDDGKPVITIEFRTVPNRRYYPRY